VFAPQRFSVAPQNSTSQQHRISSAAIVQQKFSSDEQITRLFSIEGSVVPQRLSIVPQTTD
jgi:hypothetical protein